MTDTVYLVIEHDGEASFICGVFDTVPAARACALAQPVTARLKECPVDPQSRTLSQWETGFESLAIRAYPVRTVFDGTTDDD